MVFSVNISYSDNSSISCGHVAVPIKQAAANLCDSLGSTAS